MPLARRRLTIVLVPGLLAIGLFFALSRSGVGLPFAGGDEAEPDRCAVRANGEMAGRIIEERPSSGETPGRRYRVRATGSAELFEVDADEVGVVPCAPPEQ